MEGRSTVATCPACAASVAESNPVCPTCGFDRSGGPQPFERGTVLEGRYRIDVEVGRGGMGVVYRGTDLTLSRPVAIKAMRVSGADAGVLARFMHEARALASVEHRNLVPAYAIGQEAGVYYMVMKFVEGRTLDEVLKV
ncbi:protein kinase, partial [bacterium]|nr:protein kinase [bacterium]